MGMAPYHAAPPMSEVVVAPPPPPSLLGAVPPLPPPPQDPSAALLGGGGVGGVPLPSLGGTTGGYASIAATMPSVGYAPAMPMPPGVGPGMPSVVAPDQAPPRKMCRNWSSTGSCEWGARCQFQHGDGSTPAPPMASGGYPGSNFRKTPCKFFFSPGGCPQGDRCTYKHNDNTLGPSPAVGTGPPPAGTNRPQGLCPTYYQTGTCDLKGCPYLHSNASAPLSLSTSVCPPATGYAATARPGGFGPGSKKNIPCKYGSMQACPFKERCHYSHSS